MALKPDELKEIRTVIFEAAHEVAGEVSKKQTIATVHATLTAMGMDVKTPLEQQKDFAHLRAIRVDSHDTKKAAKDAVIRWSITGLFAGIVAWLAANAPLGPWNGH